MSIRDLKSIERGFAAAALLAAAMPLAAWADTVTPPPVPANLEVPQGNTAFLVGHAVGTQNYVCLLSDRGFKFTLFTPQATLFDDGGKEIITHFFSPNPFENPPPESQLADGTVRATWQHAGDSSTVWAKVETGGSSVDPAFVAPGAVAWLKLRAVGVQRGPTGGGTLVPTTFVQRLNTHGGVAPSSGCDSAVDIGNQAFMPYTADYFFYRSE
jgi:hypothetical protein